MIFTELRFVGFFLLVWAVHWGLRGSRARKAWLLAASYAFYAAWDWRFLSLILASTLLDWAVGLRLVAPGARRRAWVLLSLAGNLGLLAAFKYAGFFVDSAVELLGWLGLQAHRPTLAIVLPVGISFYTFQTLSYSLDVHAGRLRPTRSLLDFALFVAFFPQLVAGPIVRARTFLPQLQQPRRLDRVDVRGALVLFLVGFFKKACVSDNLAPGIDRWFAAPAAFDTPSAWGAVLGYAVQIYCDFSGYSDMAIACAALLGYRLCLNFDFPYLASSLADFWRRWHVSLSTWLRDYLYVPLGGNRGSRLGTYRNLMLTMLLGGLWHGAAWTFVLWGGLHGLGLVVQRLWGEHVSRESAAARVAARAAPLLTLAFVVLAWIPFRAEGMGRAVAAARALVGAGAEGARHLPDAHLWVLPPLLLLHVATYRRWLDGWWRRVPDWGFAGAYAVLAALVLAFTTHDPQPFVYFQF